MGFILLLFIDSVNRRKEIKRGGGDKNLMFKCKAKGRKKDIQFQILMSFRIEQLSFLPCIHHQLLSL